MSHLDLIVKVAEVCNINCSYCYFFNGPDQSFRNHPPRIAASLSQSVARLVRDAAEKGEIDSARIIMHGGEPLMMGKRGFRTLCEQFPQSDFPIPIGFSIQTNAMLVDEEWIDIFEEYRFSVGVSVDGPPEYHDACRVDHRGRGTHRQTAAGIRLLTAAARAGRIPPVAALCVIDPMRSPRVIYRHIVDDLEIGLIDFLLPDGDWDSVSGADVARIGDYLGEALDEWLGDDNPAVDIRLFGEIIRFALFRNGAETPSGFVVGVSSDGSIGPDDAYRTVLPHLFAERNVSLNVRDSSLSDYRRVFHDGLLSELQTTVPGTCRSCSYHSHCRGGLGANRFSAEEGFRRQSVYCDALKRVYGELESYMRLNGVSPDRLDRAFPQVSHAIGEANERGRG
jgi:uncharacterized protein